MDTPNTRSRKRRETVLGSDTGAGPSGSHDEGGSVHWVHDNKLRKMVMEATENDTFLPPTPTQKPSYSKLSPIVPAQPSTSRHPRKRQCRNRSLPTAATPSAPLASNTGGSSSAPSGALDSLLQQAMETFNLQTPRLDTPPSGRTGARQSRDALRPTNTVNIPDQIAVPSNMPDSSKPKQSIAQANSVSPVKPLPAYAKVTLPSVNDSHGATVSRSPAKPAASSSQSFPRSSQSGGAPRIGLRSSGSGEIRPGITNPSRAFKPPLLDRQPGVRSSPRRLQREAVAAASPVRAPGATSSAQSYRTAVPPNKSIIASATEKAPSIAAASTSMRKPIAMAGSAAGPPRPPVLKDKMPSSDSAGDESFDSFDGFINDGGPEVEELLRTVDGSR
ncbi:hypothetical protein EHS25_003322 [Saitozyma podzolica]|uniref:Uncharacterized protein n=1 Tax=Saitozyma podzolica TaxID=1890683 RepID=A0A427Y8G0_9TREE|nr:hypothetical protein EHS25_003322 [Saitozyma podzolica]